MELWIRSQDREHLMYATDIDLDCDDGSIVLVNSYFMAKYKTKERALQVLDEIQDLMRSLTDSDLKIIQYEMPKE